jgi:hypothetical protein
MRTQPAWSVCVGAARLRDGWSRDADPGFVGSPQAQASGKRVAPRRELAGDRSHGRVSVT